MPFSAEESVVHTAHSSPMLSSSPLAPIALGSRQGHVAMDTGRGGVASGDEKGNVVVSFVTKMEIASEGEREGERERDSENM